MADISVFDNGPLLIKGDVTLKDGEGKEYDLEGKESIALCRCGGSQNKPFCDGSHKGGFESSCRA